LAKTQFVQTHITGHSQTIQPSVVKAKRNLRAVGYLNALSKTGNFSEESDFRTFVQICLKMYLQLFLLTISFP
jgi:hypothetical protein